MARMLVTIQYLRASSATLVVLFHAGRNYDITIPVGEGRISLFFIVSGFIFWWITVGRRADPPDFLLRRLARLVPLYWLVTTLLLVGSIAGFSRHDPVTFGHYVKSMLFIPHLDDRSGLILPVLVPGWTLVYEMFFCLLFAALLWFGETWRLWLATLALGGLTTAGYVLQPAGPIAFTYTNEIMAEFLAGVWLAHLWPRLRISVSVAAAALVAGIVMSFVALSWTEHVPMLVYSGLPALLTIVGALGLERQVRHIGWIKRIGDGSYSIYLWHIPVIVFGSRLLAKLHFASPTLAILLLTMGSIVAGLILYELIERPLTSALLARISARSNQRLRMRQTVAA